MSYSLGDALFWIVVILCLFYWYYPAPFDCAIGVKPACETLAARYK